MTEVAAQPASLASIPLALIDPSPHNPRKHFDGIAELAEDLKARGILQPLLLRPFGERFELVAGERRFRAAKKAQLETAPAIVRELTDQEAREIQLAENLQRKDLTAIEEADAYASLQKDFGYSVEDIATKFKRSPRAVYASLQLLHLGADGRKALDEARLSMSVGLLIARIPGEDLQARAVRELAAGGKDKDAVSYRHAIDIIQRNFMLPLERAEFDTTDPHLVEKAGPCTTCPKRTGNQRELFADVKSADVCTDPACFREKVDALVAVKFQKAAASGQKTIQGKSAARLFGQHGDLRESAGYVLAAGGYQSVPGRGYVNVEALLKKVPNAERVLVQEPRDGKVVELVPVKALPAPAKKERALGAAATKPRKESAGAKAVRLAQEAEAHARDALARKLVGDLVARVEKKPFGKHELLLMAERLADRLEFESTEQLVRRRSSKTLGDHYGAVSKAAGDFRKALRKMNDADLRGVIFELAVCDADAWIELEESQKGPLLEAAQAVGVDVTTADLKAQLATALKPAAAPAAKGGNRGKKS